MRKRHSRHLKNRYIILIVICLVVAYLFSLRYSPKTTQENSPSPTAQITETSPLVTSTPPHCVDEQTLSKILDKSYQLDNEQFFPEAGVLECKYDGNEQVNALTPTVDYVLHIEMPDAETTWKAQQTLISAKPSYRRIEEDHALFADVNPVKELNQVTFYGFRPQKYLELHYTPVKEAVGVQLDKGRRVAEEILGVAP